ncbi:hypothetical protein GSI_05174 [Ganoderma sinense ZZ0214-1]|uniref:DUF6534 domain-containing protein n=1 Tax=Ganoderma sinense ZZ0214-1 TaxID=1077348 RepID=A0A2G8SFF4_9APHY|nr:hypothetical protein GSI_05174 [Ganoderma sinense ZZ0214-1]
MSSSTLSPADVPLPHISIDKSFGSMLIGTFLGLVLYGITLHQVYRYTRMYPSDRIELKLAVPVYFSVVLETIHMALSCHTCYFYLVSNYLDPEKLKYPTQAENQIEVQWSGSQSFLASSSALRKLTKGWYRMLVFLAWLIACASGSALGADTILTTVLIIALRQNRSGVKRTDSVMDVLVLYTITTGLITSISVIALFLAVVIFPADVGVFTAISVIMTKFYANTLLAALNSRRSLNDRAAITISGTDIFGTEVRRQERNSSGTHARPPVSIALRANTGTQSSGSDSYGYGTDSSFVQSAGKTEDGAKGIEVRRDVVTVVDIC